LSSSGRAFLRALITKSGKQLFRLVNVNSGLYVVSILHIFFEGIFFKKSHTSCAGALKFHQPASNVAFSHFL